MERLFFYTDMLLEQYRKIIAITSRLAFYFFTILITIDHQFFVKISALRLH